MYAMIVIFARLAALATIATLAAGCATPYQAVEAPVAVVPAPQLQNGDTWVYVQIDGYNGLPVRTLTDTVRPAPGGFVIDRQGDQPGDPPQTQTISEPWRELAETAGHTRRTFSAPLARIAFPIAPGQGWREQVTMTDERGVSYLRKAFGGGLRWERVKTAAGEFVALRVERQMTLGDYDYTWSDTHVVETYWYAPEVKRWVRHEFAYERVELLVGRVRRPNRDRVVWELKEFRPAGPR